MSARTLGLSAVVLALVAGCGGGSKQVTEASRTVERQPSAEDTLRRQFEAAYFAIACIANHGKDPEMSITPMRRPSDYLAAVEGTGSPQESRVIRLLNDNGFPGIAAFRNLEIRLRGDRAYWGTVEDRFIPELKRCPK